MGVLVPFRHSWSLLNYWSGPFCRNHPDTIPGYVLFMPRYHFVIHATDATYDDPSGEEFSCKESAREYGQQVIRELREDGFDPGAVLDVRDENGQTVHSIPFWTVA